MNQHAFSVLRFPGSARGGFIPFGSKTRTDSMKAKRILAVSTALLVATGLGACGGGGEGGNGPEAGGSGGPVEMTFWHNSTTGDGKAFWAATVADFEAANPNVKISVQSIQNE